MADQTTPNLSALIQQAKAKLASMTLEERTAMYEAQRQSWVRGEMGLGLDAEEHAWREAWRQAKEEGR